nr:hypothetical protein [Tanacetum cinerariifolium]
MFLLDYNHFQKALSPGYVVDSDPEKDEKDPQEDPAYYPADRGNNDDDESYNDEDDDDDGRNKLLEKIIRDDKEAVQTKLQGLNELITQAEEEIETKEAQIQAMNG